jgi:hypothetical protein
VLKLKKIQRQRVNKAKKQSYHKQTAASSNAIKTAWDIVKENSGNICPDGSVTKIKYGDTLLDNPKEIANAWVTPRTYENRKSAISNTTLQVFVQRILLAAPVSQK